MRNLLIYSMCLAGFATIANGAPSVFVGNVRCGAQRNVICQLSDSICCQSLFSARCTKPQECIGRFSAPVYCDGPEDCAGQEGTTCCARFSFFNGSLTRCEKSCPGTATAAILCHSDSDCASPNTCMNCQPPGGPVVQMCGQQCPF